MPNKTINAEQAFAAFFELFKANPFLTKAGVMKPEDASAEDEAVSFLLTDDFASHWHEISPAAQRVSSSLLVDFLAKLNMPNSRISSSSWSVPAKATPADQARAILRAEIYRSHPHLEARH